MAFFKRHVCFNYLDKYIEDYIPKYMEIRLILSLFKKSVSLEGEHIYSF